MHYYYTTDVGLSRNTDIKTVALFSLVYSAINERIIRPTTITRNENSTFSVVLFVYIIIIIILHFAVRRR